MLHFTSLANCATSLLSSTVPPSPNTRFNGYSGIRRRGHRLRYILRGIQCSQAADPTRPPRLSILTSHLLTLQTYTASHFLPRTRSCCILRSLPPLYFVNLRHPTTLTRHPRPLILPHHAPLPGFQDRPLRYWRIRRSIPLPFLPLPRRPPNRLLPYSRSARST